MAKADKWYFAYIIEGNKVFSLMPAIRRTYMSKGNQTLS